MPQNRFLEMKKNMSENMEWKTETKKLNKKDRFKVDL